MSLVSRARVAARVAESVTAPLLLLYTARPEFRPPWPLRAHHTQIILNRLGGNHARGVDRDDVLSGLELEHARRVVKWRTVDIGHRVGRGRRDLDRPGTRRDVERLGGRYPPMTHCNHG